MISTHEPFRGEDDKLWLGWKWFELHAKQRLEAFKFFLSIFGALTTVASAFLQTPHSIVSAVCSGLALLTSLIFWQIDRRSLQLIAIGEQILDRRWNELEFGSDINPVAQSARRYEDGVRFKHAFLIIFLVAGLLSLLLLGLAVYLMNFPQTQLSLPKI